MIGAERPAGEQRIALPVHEERTDEVPGEPLVGRRAVAEQARLGLPLRDGLLLGRLVERVERRADGLVGRRDLDHPAAEAEADHHVVVEVDRAGGLGRDPLALQARLREDQHLRRLGHVERAEQRPQVAVLRLEFELRRPRVEPLLEPRDRIPRRRRAVIDRVALDVLPGGRRGHQRRPVRSGGRRVLVPAGTRHRRELKEDDRAPSIGLVRRLEESRPAPTRLRGSRQNARAGDPLLICILESIL